MTSNRLGSIQFINISSLDKALTVEDQRRAHSHAARAAHAKARRLSTIQYQSSKASQVVESNHAINERRITVKSDRHIILNAAKSNSTEQPALPSPLSLLPSDRRDPFESFVRPLKRGEHFLLDYYVRVVIPHMDRICNKNGDSATYIDEMTKDWVRLTLTNVGSLNGILLAACRHLSGYHQQHQQQHHFQQLAILYKLYCVQDLRKAISLEISSLISDGTVANSILLAYDELQLKDIATSQRHLSGLVQMVEHNGGIRKLGTDGFLERLINKFMADAGYPYPTVPVKPLADVC